MAKNAFILLDKIPEEIQKEAITNAITYAFYSLPFTVNRMSISDLKKRLENICKGKIAEFLFLSFLRNHFIKFDEDACQTPYYLPDKRDFLLGNYEWDIKNNFLYTSDLEHIINMECLPALIPDRFKGDQWTKKDRILFKDKKAAAFVFTFMPSKSKDNKSCISFDFAESPLKKLGEMIESFGNKNVLSEPFAEMYLHHIYFAEKKPSECYTVHQNLQLLITGAAGPLQWYLFKSHAPQVFMNGLIKTRIDNRMCEVGKLPAFQTFFPKAFKEIKWGKTLEIKEGK